MADQRRAAVCSLFLALVVTPLVLSQELDTSGTLPKPYATSVSKDFADFTTEFSVFWGPEHIYTTTDQMLDLTLTNLSGAGFSSRRTFIYGRINMNLKLIAGDSSGTVTTYYLTSFGDYHDELDFEFLGNQTGQPYILQTNVFANGVGEREQRIFLWFDPSADFHSYSVLWNKKQIVFFVDGVPIRVFKNNEALGMPYLNKQPMGVYSSLWNGDSWATQGGRVKINWDYAPFIATFQNYNYDACEWLSNVTVPACAAADANNWWDGAAYDDLTPVQVNELRKVQEEYMVYDYCTDTKRNPTPPVECAGNL
ncbi:hypothetical protein R1sor_011462 [Riccia sorocarpa]|uniref:Xyloglucan endotransglucosylase/hydrolase n=1 Tax=Riccia sorocarpa TaxID=122646 RepID=A0ABD3I231_9MARC